MVPTLNMEHLKQIVKCSTILWTIWVVPALGKAGWEVTLDFGEDWSPLGLSQTAQGTKIGKEGVSESLERREEAGGSKGHQLGFQFWLVLCPGQGWYRRSLTLTTQQDDQK